VTAGRARLLGAALVVAVVSVATPAHAQTQAGAWLRERLNTEWVVASGGWRTAVGNDVRAPGFDAVAGGGEILLGLEVGAGLAVMGDGRVLVGEAGGQTTYFEGLGSVALQLRLGRVRLRAGPAAGDIRWKTDSALLAGGFLAGSVDLFPLGPGRLSTTVSVRLDFDADIGARTLLPDDSLALALGLGVRY
jgi:hypothetical protein